MDIKFLSMGWVILVTFSVHKVGSPFSMCYTMHTADVTNLSVQQIVNFVLVYCWVKYARGNAFSNTREVRYVLGYVFFFSMRFSCVLKSAHMTNITQKCTPLGCINYSRIPISWTLIFWKSFPLLSQTLYFYSRFLELADFSNQFSFPLEVRLIRIPLSFL